MIFAALDVETCALRPGAIVSMAVVTSDGRARGVNIRPDPSAIMGWRFKSHHGLTVESVEDCRAFVNAWPALALNLIGMSFLAAHNAAFDREQISAACEASGLCPPFHPWLCTMKLAQHFWKRPSGSRSLPELAKSLGIPLVRKDGVHDALEDARAVLAIVEKARAAGADLSRAIYRLQPIKEKV